MFVDFVGAWSEALASAGKRPSRRQAVVRGLRGRAGGAPRERGQEAAGGGRRCEQGTGGGLVGHILHSSTMIWTTSMDHSTTKYFSEMSSPKNLKCVGQKTEHSEIRLTRFIL